MAKNRGRGRVEEGDLRHLADQNKRLKRKLGSLMKENGRIKKERDRYKPDAESSDTEVEVVQEDKDEAEVPAVSAVSVACPVCGSTDTRLFTLDVRGKVHKYVTCNKSDCRRRSRYE